MALQWNDQALSKYGFTPEEMQRLKTEAEGMGPDAQQYFAEQGWLAQPTPTAQPSGATVVPRNGGPQSVQTLEEQPQTIRSQYPGGHVPDESPYQPGISNTTLLRDEAAKGRIPEAATEGANTFSQSTDTQPANGQRVFNEDDYNTMVQAAPEMADVYRGWIGRPYSEIDQSAVNAAKVSLGLPLAAVGGGAMFERTMAPAPRALDQFGRPIENLTPALQNTLSNTPAGYLGPGAQPGGVMFGRGGNYFLP